MATTCAAASASALVGRSLPCSIPTSSGVSTSARCIQGRWIPLGVRAPAANRQTVIAKCALEDDVSKEKKSVSRREVFSFATLAVLLSAKSAQAKDVPLFGIRKQLESAQKAVESVGEKGVESVSSFTDAVGNINTPSVPGLSPVVQAGGVLGAELVAVLAAASVVNGLVSVPSKGKGGKGGKK